MFNFGDTKMKKSSFLSVVSFILLTTCTVNSVYAQGAAVDFIEVNSVDDSQTNSQEQDVMCLDENGNAFVCSADDLIEYDVCIDENGNEVSCDTPEIDTEDYICIDENDNEVPCTDELLEEANIEADEIDNADAVCYDELGNQIDCDS